MAEDFTGTVSDPTIQPVQPLRTNTGSDVTDALSAVQFGVDLYRRSQVRDQQQAQLQMQANLGKATENVLKEQEALVGQGVSGTKLEFNVVGSIEEQAKKFGVNPLDLRRSVAQFRGKTTAERLIATQTAEQKAVLDAQESRRNDEEALSANFGFLPPDEADFNIQDLTDKELHSKLLIANANKSILQAQTDRATLSSANARSTEAKRSIDVRNFSDNFIVQASNSLGQQIVKQASALDLSDPSMITEAIRDVANLKADMPAQIRQAANNNGIQLSRNEVNAIQEELNQKLDTFTKMLNRSDIKDLGDNLIKQQVSGIFHTLQTGTPQQQVAANSLIISKVVGVPPELNSFNMALKTAAQTAVTNRLSDAKQVLDDGMRVGVPTPKQSESAWNNVKQQVQGMFSPQVSEVPEQHKQAVSEMLIKNFSGSRRELQDLVSSGGYNTLLSGMASDQAKDVMSSDDLEEIQETVVPVMQDVTASAISLFMRSQQQTQFSIAGSTAPERASKAFEIDPDTLMLKPRGALVRQTSQSRGLNSMLSKTLKALENIGYSEKEIRQFKDDVLEGFGIVRTQSEGDANAEGEQEQAEVR